MTPDAAPQDLRFAWQALDATGAARRGSIVAPDAAAARAMLRRDSLFVVELAVRGPALRPKARTADVTLFARQLSSLLRADRKSVV